MKIKSDLKFYQNLEFVIRLLEILEKPVTVHHIAKRVGVTDRSVYRWIVHLKEMEFEIEDHKGWYILTKGNSKMNSLAARLMERC